MIDIDLKRKGLTVQELWDCMSRAGSMQNVPGLLLNVIREEAWKDRLVTRTKERRQFNSFVAFLEATPPDGLGVQYEKMRDLCDFYQRNDVILEMAKLVGQRGGNNNPEGHNQCSKEVNRTGGPIDHGGSNTPERVLRRLDRERPDLRDKVLSGELTRYAAAKEAGFRKSTPEYRIPKDPIDAGKYLAGRVDSAWIETMLDAYRENS